MKTNPRCSPLGSFYQHESTLRLTLEGLGVTRCDYPSQAVAIAPDMTEFFQRAADSIPRFIFVRQFGGRQILLAKFSGEPIEPVMHKQKIAVPSHTALKYRKK